MRYFMITNIDNLEKYLSMYYNKTVLTNGCFDVFHIGHLRTLQRAISYGNMGYAVIVAINADESVRKLKGNNRPINNFKNRAEIVDNIRGINYIIPIEEVSVLSIVERIKPNILIKGGTTDYIVGKDFVESYGGEVINSEEIKGFSSTNIIERMNDE